MAEDYLTDDEQLEAIKRWLSENGPWLLAGVLLGAGGLFGWRYYDSYRNTHAQQAATQFGQVTAALDHNDTTDARRIAEEMAEKYSGSPYADQAELTLAHLYVDAGQPAQAVAPLTRVANSSKDAELRKIARLRLARVLIDQGKPDAAIETLRRGASGPFASLYAEARGDALYAKKDIAGALGQYRQALAESDPSGGDGGLLMLKIADLGSAPATGAPMGAPVPKAQP